MNLDTRTPEDKSCVGMDSTQKGIQQKQQQNYETTTTKKVSFEGTAERRPESRVNKTEFLYLDRGNVFRWRTDELRKRSTSTISRKNGGL